ncbi:PTS transporter subunit IIC [Anaerotalea alkaliphila]|uniref:PTS sugar transporter subunit IIC n=1 Tax=Anaerotalea alkaliphila TaxID=2662126 RepID=A0A7X5HWP6_9FIRM|nr:PTS sugar transporter subunit IIC [Anaerotalea alkaliphila]NDL68060.1 PTS sugar transporter subunit IIC [Anaerotalea alkaliphila]
MGKRAGISQLLKAGFKRYLIDGLGGMALGLFTTLIVGLILKQLGAITGLLPVVWFGSIASVLTGAGIGMGVAHRFKVSPMVLYSSAVTGMMGAYAGKILSGAAFVEGNVVLIGPGEPLGAFIAAVVGIEFGRIVSGRTKLEIVLTPMATILAGGTAGLLVGPGISAFMLWLGSLIVMATEQAPFIMGILVSTMMGMALTLPISSAALSIILGLEGLAAGAATVGCATQMIGFAVASYRENKMNGLLAQGLGTSMLQMPNILRNPRVWIPPTVASALLGPLATVVFKMANNPSGAGMGTSGLVGPLMTWSTMAGSRPDSSLLLQILLLHFLLPAGLTLVISESMRKKNWIKPGDLRLDV